MAWTIAWLWFLQICLPAEAPNTVPAPSSAPQIAFRVGHRASLQSSVFSPDGKLLATGSQDGEIKLWEAHTGELLRTLHAPAEDIYSLVFSPDGATLATGSTTFTKIPFSDSHVMLWDTATGRLRRTLGEAGRDSYPGDVLSVAFLPAGDRVAVCTHYLNLNRSDVDLWDAHTGLLLRRISNAYSPAFSPDGRRMVAAFNTPDMIAQAVPGVKIWDVETGTLLQTLDTEGMAVAKLIYSPDGKTLAGIGSPPGIRGIFLDPDPWQIDLKPDKIFLWDTQTGAKQHTLVRNITEIRTVAFAPDSRTLAGAHMDTRSPAGEAVVWDIATGKALRALPFAGRISSLAYSQNGSRLITLHTENALSPKRSGDTIVSLWNLATGTLLHTVSFGEHSPLSSLVSAPDGRTLVVYGYAEGAIRRLEPTTLKQLSFAPGRQGNAQPIAFSPDGRFLVSGGRNAEAAMLWDLHTGRLARRLPSADPSRGGTQGVAFTPDSKTAAILRPESIYPGVPGELSLWDMRSGRRQSVLQKSMPPAPGPVDLGSGLIVVPIPRSIWNGFAFTPDGRTVITGGAISNDGVYRSEGDLTWWNLPSGTQRFQSHFAAGEILGLAISPDGKLLATSNGEQTLIRDVVTGAEIKKLIPQENEAPSQANTIRTIRSLVFSPDSKILAVGDDRVLRLWDVSTGTELDRLEGHTGQIHSVAFSPDGMQIASAGEDGTVRLWDLSPRKEPATALASHLLPDGPDHLRNRYNVRTLFQHDRPMTSVAFSPDGRLLVAASEGDTLRLWNVRTGDLLLTIRTFLPRDPHAPSAWISYTPEGYYEGSANIKDYLRWQVGDRLLPAASFEKRYHVRYRVVAALKSP